MVIEMLDARMPASSENPLLAQLSKGKPKLKILNKQDLADPERTKVWLEHYNSRQDTRAIALDSSETGAHGKITPSLPRYDSASPRYREAAACPDLRHSQCRQIHLD